MQRRQFAGAAGVAALGLAPGCFGYADDWGEPPDGGLKLRNETDSRQAVEISIQRRPDGPRSGTSTPGPSSTPTGATELQVTVESDGRALRDGVIESPGRYYVRAEVTSATAAEGRTGRRWLRFGRAGEGDGIAGGHVLVTLTAENVHVAQVQD